MNKGPQVQADCPARRGPDARIISPLPNLRLEPGAAVAEIVHHPLLEPINGSPLSGSATVKLRGQALQVCVTADRRVHIDLRRRRTAETRGAAGGGELLLVVTACGAAQSPCASSATFDLSMRDGFAELGPEDLVQLSALQAEALGHAALQGLPTRGWLAGPLALLESGAPSPAPGSDRTYFVRRIKDEIHAALRAKEPAVASRHVQLATLLAGRLQDCSPGRPASDARA